MGDATRLGAVSVLLRRVVAARAVRRLLILGGLLIACWVLGGAAQTAHAEEIPVNPSQIVTRTPVLGDVVKTVPRPEPVRRVVQAVAEKEPREQEAPPEAPPLPQVQEATHNEGDSANVTQQSEMRRRPPERERVPAASAVDKPAPTVGTSQPVVQHDPDPLQTPERPDGHSTAGASAVPVMTAAFPNVVAWAPAPPRASGSHLFGAVPPAVRTAADEPSFAPD